MKVFRMKTLEGPTIPVLMVKKGYTIHDINTYGMYPDAPNSKKYQHRSSPKQTQEWFDATDDELYRFMNGDLSIGSVIMRAPGRKLTLPYSNGDVAVTIAPGAYEHDEYEGIYELKNDGKGTTRPWMGRNHGVLFYGGPEDEIAVPSDNNIMFIAMGYEHGIIGAYRIDRSKIKSRGEFPVAVLIRDENGDGKVIVLAVIYDKMQIDGQIVARTYFVECISNGYLTCPVEGRMTDDFWREQTEEKERECVGKMDLKERFDPRIATSGIGVYKITKEKLTDFMFDMWSTNLIEKLVKGINGEALDNVLSLKWYYGIGKSIKTFDKDVYLTLGNVAFDGAWNESGPIKLKAAKKSFVQFSLGEVDVKRYYNNFLDYAPYTEMEIFLPFYGIHRLNVNEFINSKLAVDYYINILTGATVINITSGKGDCYRPVAVLQTTMGVDIPFRVTAMEDLLSRLTSMVSSTVTQAGSAITAGAAGAITLPVAGPVMGAVGNIPFQGMGNNANPIFNNTPTMRQLGGMNDEIGSMSYFKSFITYIRPVSKAPDNYNSMVGSPDFSTGKISNFQGYIKVGAINNKSTSNIPREAMAEIEQLLKYGVYTS